MRKWKNYNYNSLKMCSLGLICNILFYEINFSDDTTYTNKNNIVRLSIVSVKIYYNIYLYIFSNCKTKIISVVPIFHLTRFNRAIFSRKADINFSHFSNCFNWTDYTGIICEKAFKLIC